MATELEGLIDEFFDLIWRSSPTAATAAGEHRFDDQLVDCAPGVIEARHRTCRDLQARLRRLRDRGGLAPDDGLDAEVVDRELDVHARLLEEVRAPFRDPNFYLDEILYGLYLLVQRDFAPLEERLDSMLGRLRATPRLLRQGISNLADPEIVPQEWVVAFLGRSSSAGAFLAQIGALFMPVAGSRDGELRKAIDAGAAALRGFEAHVRASLDGRATGRFAVGAPLFEFLLRRQHGVDRDATAVADFGASLLRSTREELEEAARSIDPSRSWQELVESWKDDHPAPGDVLREYGGAIDRARAFVLGRDLAAIPEDDELHVVATPPFQRIMSPFAAYLPPAPFEERARGELWITTPDEQAAPSEQAQALRDHLRPGIDCTIAHEVYPGHHLQLTVAARLRSRVRRFCGTPVFIEGWAFYCEHLMAEQGFYDDRRSRVIQLKDQLWRAARVVIDVGLQTGSMDFEAAVAELRDTARLETPNARREVMRYVRTPTQPLSYATGKEEILRLRDDCRRARGGSFSLREFHDAVLSYGSIPLSLIRSRLLGAQARGGSAG